MLVMERMGKGVGCIYVVEYAKGEHPDDCSPAKTLVFLRWDISRLCVMADLWEDLPGAAYLEKEPAKPRRISSTKLM